MSLTGSNVPHYTGYIVNELPDDPKVGVYHCHGKLQKWIPSEWIEIDTPSRYYFDDLETGKTQHFGSKNISKKSCHNPCPVKDPCKETPCTEGDVEVIVNVLNVAPDAMIIRVPIIGRCPVVSRYSQIRPIAIENGVFVVDVSGVPDDTIVALTYRSVGSILMVNQLIHKRKTCPVGPSFF